MNRGKITLGAYLVSTMLLLVIGTILLSGLFTWHQSRETVKTMAADAIEDNINLVDLQVQSLLRETESSNAEIARLLSSKGLLQPSRFTVSELRTLLKTLGDQILANDDLAYLSLTLEGSGEFLQVSRDREGRPLYQVNVAREPGLYDRKDYLVGLHGEEEVFRDKAWKVDSRTRPYYRAAKAAHEVSKEVAWTPAYKFIPSGNQKEELGVTCARPLRGPSGELLGVVTADLTLTRLEGFLNSIRIREVGYGFVIQTAETDASPAKNQVLAVPKNNLMDSRSDVQANEVMSAFAKRSTTGAQALTLENSDSLVAESDGERLVVGYRRVRWPGVDWVVFAVVPESAYLGALNSTYQTATKFAGVLALAGALLAFLLARRVAQPLKDLTEQAARIGRLDLTHPSQTDNMVTEVNALGQAMERMRNSLRSFERLVPRAYVRYLMDSNQEAMLSVDKRELTILFADLEGFTSQADSEPLEVIVPRLNKFLQSVSDAVTAEGGTIDKYLGDEVMAFWGAPHECANREIQALRAAHQVLATLPEGLRARVGVASGVVVVGNIGTPDRMNYTCIGDRVNLASRLQGLNKVYGTSLLVDEVTAQALGEEFLLRPIDKVAVMGRQTPEIVCEVYRTEAASGEFFTKWLSMVTKAFERYQEARFPEAEALYYEAMLLREHDVAAQVMMQRCQEFRHRPPGANWAGVFTPLSK